MSAKDPSPPPPRWLLTSFFTTLMERTLSTMAASSSLGFSWRRRREKDEDDGGRRRRSWQMPQNSNREDKAKTPHHKKLHGGQRLALRLWLRRRGLWDRRLLGSDRPRHVQLFIFLIVGDLDVQIFGVFLALDLPIRPPFLERKTGCGPHPCQNGADLRWRRLRTCTLVSSSSRGDCAGITSASELSEEALRFRFFPTTGVMVLPGRDGSVRRAEMGRMDPFSGGLLQGQGLGDNKGQRLGTMAKVGGQTSVTGATTKTTVGQRWPPLGNNEGPPAG